VDKSTEMLVGMAAAALLAVVAVAVYRRGRHRRALRVGASARAYLFDRYGQLPGNLTINCSDDTLWPVLVAFDHPKTGARHRLQFGVRERDSSVALVSETTDNP
jgi:hypothetical protein